MTTKFEQVRSRPKPPREESFKRRFVSWVIVKSSAGTWLAFHPFSHRSADHQSWREAMDWVEEQVKHGR